MTPEDDGCSHAHVEPIGEKTIRGYCKDCKRMLTQDELDDVIDRDTGVRDLMRGETLEPRPGRYKMVKYAMRIVLR